MPAFAAFRVAEGVLSELGEVVCSNPASVDAKNVVCDASVPQYVTLEEDPHNDGYQLQPIHP